MKFIHEDVSDELVDAVFHYDLEREGLGERFRVHVLQTAARITANPRAFARVHEIVHVEIRKAIVPRFPYVIFFYVAKNWEATKTPFLRYLGCAVIVAVWAVSSTSRISRGWMRSA